MKFCSQVHLRKACCDTSSLCIHVMDITMTQQCSQFVMQHMCCSLQLDAEGVHPTTIREVSLLKVLSRSNHIVRYVKYVSYKVNVSCDCLLTSCVVNHCPILLCPLTPPNWRQQNQELFRAVGIESKHRFAQAYDNGYCVQSSIRCHLGSRYKTTRAHACCTSPLPVL